MLIPKKTKEKAVRESGCRLPVTVYKGAMPCKQLRLFQPYRPLAERLGYPFFDTVPQAPGIYTMLGAAGEILYIGQSKNLRHRLATYKNAQVGQASQKTLRLVQRVHRILWTVCPSPQTAQCWEARLIRQHQPTFNRQHAWPASWYYLGLDATPDTLTLRLHTHPPAQTSETVYGAFKGLTLGRRNLQALTRLLWSFINQPTIPLHLPLALSFRLTECTLIFGRGTTSEQSVGRRITTHQGVTIKAGHVPSDWDLTGQLHEFLRGQSQALIDTIRLRLDLPVTEDHPNGASRLLGSVLSRDLEYLDDFYAKGPATLWSHSQSAGVNTVLLTPDQLNETLNDWAKPVRQLPRSESRSRVRGNQLEFTLASSDEAFT